MNKAVLAIDPGPVTSGWVLFDGARVLECESKADNWILLNRVAGHDGPSAVEWVTHYGKVVGVDVFETTYWTGAFSNMAYCATERCASRISRPDCAMHLCGARNVTDSGMNAALSQRFGGVEGMRKAKGTKVAPGPLYGVSGHAWSALAIAVTWWDTRRMDVS